MTSILRQIVAGPRVRHAEADLDLCYVTDNIIATSGPSGTYPQVAYRNPLKDLVKFLDRKHGAEWSIWEFRAEGTGYPDSEVYGRIRHYPWPDHHPPPFALIPLIMASMRNWLKDKDAEGKGRVAVVHCKAGKGRSGTVSASYLISEEGWSVEDAVQRFTERRMKPGFGAGISIPSQKRTISYVDRWAKSGKTYIERPAEVLEVHVWGLRNGVKIAVEGYVEEGKVIKTFHTFSREEREVVRGGISKRDGFSDVAFEVLGRKDKSNTPNATEVDEEISSSNGPSRASTMDDETGGDVVFRPSSRIVLPSSDINLDFERRNRTKMGGFTMVTAVAHVWFNTYFEGKGPEQNGRPDDSGVFTIDWDAMDGIKGSSRKGTRAFDRMAVVWRTVPIDNGPGIEITQPAEGEEVKETRPADWRGGNNDGDDFEKKLGLREATTESASVSRASSVRSQHNPKSSEVPDEIVGTQPHLSANDTGARHHLVNGLKQASPLSHTRSSPELGENDQPSMDDLVSGTHHLSTADLPDGVPEHQLDGHQGKGLGSMGIKKHSDGMS